MSGRRLFVYGVTAEEWTKRYGVVSFSCRCSDCEEILTTSIPFVEGPLRGLQAPECVNGCHASYTEWVNTGCSTKYKGSINSPPYAMLMGPMFDGLRDGSWPPKKMTKKEQRSAPSAKVIRLR